MERYSRNHVQDLKAALSTDWKSWNIEKDEQLSTLIQNKEKQPFSILSHPVSELVPELEKYSLLKAENIETVKLRIMLILFINDYMSPVSKLINFDQVSKPWSLAHQVVEIRGLIFFEIKRILLKSIISSAEITWFNPKDINLNRLTAIKQADLGYQNGNEMDTLYGQAFSQLVDNEREDPKMWFARSPAFRVNFKGEGGTDQGGLYNEALSQFCTEWQSNALALFINTPNGTNNVGLNREKFIPRSSSTSAIHLSMYTMIGKLLGHSIRNDHPLALDFPSIVWKQLVANFFSFFANICRLAKLLLLKI